MLLRVTSKSRNSGLIHIYSCSSSALSVAAILGARPPVLAAKSVGEDGTRTNHLKIADKNLNMLAIHILQHGATMPEAKVSAVHPLS